MEEKGTNDKKRRVEMTIHGSMKKKRLKRDGETLEMYIKNLNWSQCHHFMPKKRRLCNVQRVKGSNYCGLHRAEGEGGDSGAPATVPCPVDPSHSVLATHLKRHLKVPINPNPVRNENPDPSLTYLI